MKIKYLGTAAAEGIPALFCDCRVCRNALAVKGKEIKTRSQAIIDDKLLIDFPADTYMHMLMHDVDLIGVRTCIVTHCHMDHLYERDLWCRNRGIGNGSVDGTVLDMYLSEASFKKASVYCDASVDKERTHLHVIKPFEAFESEGYRIIPLKADHDPSTEPLIYIIESGDKTMLYANDTGFFPEETWDYLAGYGRKFDFVSYDCTGVLLTNYHSHHMCLESDVEIHQRLCDMGLCDEKTVKYVNHFSHNGRATHEELVVEAAKFGFGVSYDGLEVEF